METVINLILYGLGSIFLAVLSIFASMLPNAGNEIQAFATAFQTVASVGKQLGFIIPWSTLFTVVGIGLITEFAVMLVKFIMWLIRIIRG